VTPARLAPPGVWTRRLWLRGRIDGPPRSDAVQLAGLLDSPEIAELVAELEATRWTGRPGYPVHAMVSMGAGEVGLHAANVDAHR